MSGEMSADTLKCPHCSGDLDKHELVAQLMEKSELSFRVYPKDGERLSATTVGGTLTNMEKLLNASGKQVGIKTLSTVKNIHMHEDGSIETTLLLTRVSSRIKKQPDAIAAE